MTAPLTGVLLVNVGSPQAPTSAAVRHYLAEFLSDRRVITWPAYLWQPLLKTIVLPMRAPRLAKLYHTIWLNEGSPLVVYSQRLAKKVQAGLGYQFKVVLAMRYGKPTIQTGLEQLRAANVRSIVVLPLYPQYSAATNGSCFDSVSGYFKKSRFTPHLHFISWYFDHPWYIQAMCESLQNFWSEHGKKVYLLFSFHGLPKRCSERGDPYEQHCAATVRLIAEKLQLSTNNFQLVFQSRFGKAAWLQPYCEPTLKQLARRGIKQVAVICPGFAVDCLETLEEIAVRYRKVFLQAGGERFHYIPALNDSLTQCQLLSRLIQQVKTCAPRE